MRHVERGEDPDDPREGNGAKVAVAPHHEPGPGAPDVDELVDLPSAAEPEVDHSHAVEAILSIVDDEGDLHTCGQLGQPRTWRVLRGARLAEAGPVVEPCRGAAVLHVDGSADQRVVALGLREEPLHLLGAVQALRGVEVRRQVHVAPPRARFPKPLPKEATVAGEDAVPVRCSSHRLPEPEAADDAVVAEVVVSHGHGPAMPRHRPTCGQRPNVVLREARLVGHGFREVL
mmetsp:Transcript_71923/g.210705  ORF Transcript_71923/g.210705 Transcript_71923/m.210705 type:complete len:231 (+) Transcript_71923:1749-2441(+)